MNEDELWAHLRLQSIEDIKEVKRATLEPDGQVSVIQEEWARPLEKGDLEDLSRGRSPSLAAAQRAA
jgi:uncharacterized membrane protein YcaP (DUF421 family)